MKCDRCGKNEATFHYKTNINGRVTEAQLCPDCARAITQNLVDSEAVSREVGQALLAAVGERALRTVPKERRSALRADIFKQILIHSV